MEMTTEKEREFSALFSALTEEDKLVLLDFMALMLRSQAFYKAYKARVAELGTPLKTEEMRCFISEFSRGSSHSRCTSESAPPSGKGCA